jgi:hypothetical protein
MEDRGWMMEDRGWRIEDGGFTRKVKQLVPAPRICYPYPSERLSRRFAVNLR